MRSTCALYVDVGYLLSSAATRVTGTSLRSGIYVDYPALVSALARQAEELSGLPLLRVHWYDSAHQGIPDEQQQRIGELAKVKLRLGRFGFEGQQKGVDLRIGLDLVAHARNDAADVFFLVSGDDDLTEAVEEAQTHGVQVILLTVPASSGKPHGVSRHLVRAADDLELVDAGKLDGAVTKIDVPRPAPTTAPAAPRSAVAASAAGGLRAGAVPSPKDLAAARRPLTSVASETVVAYSSATGGTSVIAPGYDESEHDDLIDEVVTRVLERFRGSATPEQLNDLHRGRPSIPPAIDRALLVDVSDAIGIYDLSDPVRYRLRARFWEKYDAP